MNGQRIDIPGYTLQHVLGEGGMATVYLAEQHSLRRPVALKVMSAALTFDPSFSERFQREGRIVASLTHPNIITVFDIGTVAGRPYLAMEYVEGGTLQQRIDYSLELPELLAILRDLVQALAYAHERGIIHRDIKPGNVLFQARGRAKLSDFGIAKALSVDGMATALTSATAVGTPNYMSPEQARGQRIDARADQYGLGVLLYECLTGHAPYQASDPFALALKHITEPVPSLGEELARFQPLLQRLMAKDPVDRFPDDQAILAALDRLESGERGSRSQACQVAPPEAVTSGSRRLRMRSLWTWATGRRGSAR